MQRFVVKSKQEFLNEIRKASCNTVCRQVVTLWREFVCSLGELNMQILSYNKYEVIEILPHVADVFKIFWSKVPEIKYYFIQRLDENDNHGAVIPATSNEQIEKWLESEIK